MRTIIRDEKNIALVDKYALRRCGFVHFVNSLSGYNIIDQVDSIQSLDQSTLNYPIDILVTDIFNSEESINSQIKDICYYHEQHPKTHIVFYTSMQDQKTLMFLRDVANFSVISRKEPVEEIYKYIELAFNGDNVISPIISNVINMPIDKYSLSPLSLTRQENEVLSFYLNGMNLTQIARVKNRSIKTVSAQKCSGMRKLGVYNDADFFLYKKGFIKATTV